MSENCYRQTRRGFSLSQGNESLVSEARSIILDKIEEKNQHQTLYFKDSTDVTFLLPNLSKYETMFKKYLEKDLIEKSSLTHLEQFDRLNWWCDKECIQQLWPLATSGDGNCLLHAASLAMWGFHDRHLTLRHAIHHRLILENLAFHRRWLYQSVNDQKIQGFNLSKEEFDDEWSEICNLSFPSPKGSHKPIDLFTNEDENNLLCCRKGTLTTRNSSQKSNNHTSPSKTSRSPVSTLPPVPNTSRDKFYDFLEQIHVFVLAQVIRRPIIIISDTYVRDADGQPIQPLNFGGLYLPLLEKPDCCEKSPILLTYSNCHFSALVPMDFNGLNETCSSNKLPLAVPLIDPATFELLPVHFAIDPGEDWTSIKLEDVSKLKQSQYKQMIKTYLNCDEIKFCPQHKRSKPKSEDDTNNDIIHESNKHSLSRNIGKQIKEKFSRSKSKSSSTSSNQSQNNNQTINWDKFDESNSFFGAKLKIKLPLNYKEMIENYLKDAELNFDKVQMEKANTVIDSLDNNTDVTVDDNCSFLSLNSSI